MNRGVKPLLLFGTRPEAIKMAPVVKACRRNSSLYPVVCLTGQHRQMLDQVTDYFGIGADVDLGLMQAGQGLARLAGRCIEGINQVVQRYEPDCILAQGDTTTVMAASLVAFYRKVPFIHVEAGLRSGSLDAPWPEEFNRRVVSLATQVHCAPTAHARQNLIEEGIPEQRIALTGNTVVDALLETLAKERNNSVRWQRRYDFLGEGRMVLITGHRRENFGSGMERICAAINALAERYPDVAFLYPVHLNPNVQGPVHQQLGGHRNVFLLPPVSYPEFVWLMDRCTLILTDSGGIQEEAPSLKKPALVMRDKTERPEGVAAGAVELVGTGIERIVEAVSLLLTDDREYRSRQITDNPYGDGQAAERIAKLIEECVWER